MPFILRLMRLIVVLSALPLGHSQAADTELLGVVSREAVATGLPSFEEYYQQYQSSPAEIDAVKALAGKTLVVLFGAWCHDSQRELPRLLRTLDDAGVHLADVQLLAVDRNKQEPSGRYRQLQLRFTPTVILFDGEQELGRVIEIPRHNWGSDLAALLNSAE